MSSINPTPRDRWLLHIRFESKSHGEDPSSHSVPDMDGQVKENLTIYELCQHYFAFDIDGTSLLMITYC